MESKKIIDIDYAASSFLQYRSLFDKFQFAPNLKVQEFSNYEPRKRIETVQDVDNFIKEYIKNNYDSETLLLLSGGIDSAIIASYLPKGAETLTFDTGNSLSKQEITNAKKFADYYSLKNDVLEITWEDHLEYALPLMKHKGAPIHSIEVQIAKASNYAKNNGFKKLLFGEAADVVFGGFDKLLNSSDNYNEFIYRFTHLDPRKLLKNGYFIDDFFRPYKRGDKIDKHKFISEVFYVETLSSYQNACSMFGLEFLSPYPHMELKDLDFSKIREGESKYLLRCLYSQKYQGIKAPTKIPMPRAMDKWLGFWNGPTNELFDLSFDFDKLNPDQKWMLYSLDLFLNNL